MLAQARPLWSALPDGALRRQLLPELARQAQLETADLVSLCEPARRRPRGPNRRAARRQAPTKADADSRVSAGPLAWTIGGRSRVCTDAPWAPATGGDSADLALRLLLRHSDWWDRLSADDHELLHALGGAHGAAVAWLDRYLTEHGATTWATLTSAMVAEPWAAEARGWVDSAVADEEQRLDDLRRVMHRLWHAHLGAEVAELIAQGVEDRQQLDQVAALRRRIDFTAARSASCPCPADPDLRRQAPPRFDVQAGTRSGTVADGTLTGQSWISMVE